MTCLEVMNKILRFIEGKMTDDELAPFLDHIRSCPDCREELDIYYTVMKSIDHLDEDKDVGPLNLEEQLRSELRTASDRLTFRSVLETVRLSTMTLAYLATIAALIRLLFMYHII